MKTKIVTRSLGYLVSMGCLLGASMAQDHAFSASGEAVVVSRFVWRGQRLTNDWSFQPSMTLGVGGFSFNAWGSMDMTAVNEGPGLLIPENPLATPGGTNDGLKGQFSEVDYTLSFGHSFEHVSFDFGSLFYTSPPRSSSVASTTELFGAIGFDSAPLAPSATVYVDVDEAMIGGGDPGVYVLIEAEQRISSGHRNFPGIDLSGSIGFVNKGFTQFNYGIDESGPHDASFTLSLPITFNDNWSFSGFVTYSALIGDQIRRSQFQDNRKPARPTGATFADTIWRGFSLILTF